MEDELSIVLVAAGASTRMGFAKLWAPVNGRPLLAHTLERVAEVGARETVLVVASDRLEEAARLAPSACVVPGGARRRDSVAAGLAASRCQWLAVHDAARALAPPALFSQGLEAARESGCAVPGVPLKDTIRSLSGKTLARAELVAVQTPQLFRRDLLERALALTDEDVTDEAALVERLGVPVAVFPGDELNFKVTTPLDLRLAACLLG